MKDILQGFQALFLHNSIELKENFTEVKLELKGDDFKELKGAELAEALKLINPRDKLQLSIIIGEGESIDYYSPNPLNDFLQELGGKMELRETEDVTITIQIFKSHTAGILSIYAYDSFLSFLESLTFQALLQSFSSFFKKDNLRVLENQSLGLTGRTNTIFLSNKDVAIQADSVDRVGIADKAKTACHSDLTIGYFLVPEDFSIRQSECPKLRKMFGRVEVAMSMLFLYDISKISGDDLSFVLNGYKSIKAAIRFTDIKRDPANQYFTIYKWVYNSGNFIDKIGLARNIISLHIDQQDVLVLKGEPFRSLQSGYKVYEQQNINQYILVRNAIADQLLNFHDRANAIVESFGSGFQKSALALITFYSSVIVVKILSKDKLENVFTWDGAILSTVFILLSAIYLYFSRWDLNRQRLRFISHYLSLKRRYTDLLDNRDIERILNNDREYIEDLDFIRTRFVKYTIMWVVYLGVLLIATWGLYGYYHI